MKIEGKQFIEIVGLSAVILSLMFVGYELRLSRDIARLEGLGTAGQFQVDVYDSIAQHADIWRRGCEGDALSPEEKAVFANVYGQVEIRSFITYQRASTGITNASPEPFVRTFALSVYRFPGFRSMWEEFALARTIDLDPESHSGWWRRVEQLVNEFEEMNVPKSVDAAFCGRA